MSAREIVVDPISREVIRSRLVAICDEMAVVLESTCYSPMIRDVRDYSTGLVDAEGRTLAINSGGLPSHFAELGEAVRDGLLHYEEEGFAAGDAVLVNHTFVTGQHVNNVQVYAPIVGDDGELLGFAAAYAHWQDVGGVTANRPTAGTTDCYQEGLQIRSVKVRRGGEEVADVLRLITGNLRQPELGLGDLRAQMGACDVGVAGFGTVLAEFGPDSIAETAQWSWDLGERAARDAVRSIPDGEYSADAFLDDNAHDDDTTVPIAVRITVSGDEMEMDFSELSDQVPGPLNSRSDAAPNLVFKALTTPHMPLSLGDFRPLTVTCPEGKLIRAADGAPMGSWSWPFTTMIDVMLTALEPAIPGRVAASSCGAFYGAGFFFGVDERTGKRYSSLSLIPIGWGGRPGGDGPTAHGYTFVGLRDTPGEVSEQLCPVVVERYQLRPDTGGAGEFRGGLGVEYTVRFFFDAMACFELDRTKCPPWGLHGGKAGAPGRQTIILPDGEEVTPPRRAVNYPIPGGSRVVIATGGGGGFGDPAKRTPERVRDDVIDGYVSRERALADYGVELAGEWPNLEIARVRR